MFLLGAPARAGDNPPAPPVAAAPRSWTGFYAGAHAGGLFGTTTFSDPDGPPLYGGTVSSPGFLAGVQLGYNHQIAPQWVVGLEADASWLTAMGSNTCLQSSVTIVGSNCKVTPRALGTVAGRVGFVTEPHGRTLLYGRAGVAWMRADVSMNPNNVPHLDQGFINNGFTFTDTPDQGDPTSASLTSWGPTVGAGVEYALSSAWSLKMQYDYMHFGGLSVPTPQTTDVTINGQVTNLPSSGFSSVTQDFHAVRLGLNYRFGVGSGRAGADGSAAYGAAAPPAAPWVAGWDIDVGLRYWYSSGSFQTANGAPNILVSRLTYDGVTGHSGELHARVDTPFDVFFKGFVGGGSLATGNMYDEDWGLSSNLAAVPTSYEVTQSNISGSLFYLTADLGYNVMRGRDHKVGLFVGYNRYETTMNAMGCAQLVQPASEVCFPASPTSTNVISEFDTWQSLRLGVSAEARIWDRFTISGDFAWLPYVKYDGLDIHRLRNLSFPVQGTGRGGQAEIILSYQPIESFSIGVGGRYWTMWTDNASQTDSPSNVFEVETQRYGVFVQATYRFKAPR